MSYHSHAMREFRAAGWTDAEGKFTDGMQEVICDNVLALLNVFDSQGHSGSSAPYAINLFEKLARFEPVTPITGEDFEWMKIADGKFQNTRCSHVFKDDDRFNGQAYDIDAIIFYDVLPDGDKSYFTCRESAQPIEFPYVPMRQYQERKGD